MRGLYLSMAAGLALAGSLPAVAKTAIALVDPMGGGPNAPAPGVLQCVPFARTTSGIQLYGDAHTWWRQAEGKYARGHVPYPGAVMAISPHGGSALGHVATVSRILDARTILISHANWSAPGKIERNVTAMDVSPANDWSEVRVWYAPIAGLGGAHWPVDGFIYKNRPGALDRTSHGTRLAKLPVQTTMKRFVPSKTVEVRFGDEPQLARSTWPRATSRSADKPSSPKQSSVRHKSIDRLAIVDARRDPIGAIISRSR